MRFISISMLCYYCNNFVIKIFLLAMMQVLRTTIALGFVWLISSAPIATAGRWLGFVDPHHTGGVQPAEGGDRQLRAVARGVASIPVKGPIRLSSVCSTPG